jgi:4-amino-4-deoxy-L-arabinose transferase-like glycosyltransferase
MAAAVILAGVFGLWATRLDAPYTGRHDNNTAWVHIAASNYLRLGYGTLKLGQVRNADPQSHAPLNYYRHHPPLVSLLASFSIRLFGNHEASVRLVPMFLTLISGAAVFALAKRGYGSRVALLSLLLFVTTPMIAFYGQMANHEEVTLPPLLLAGLFYLRYLQRPATVPLVALAVCLALATWAGWPAFFFVAGLCIHAFFLSPNRKTVIGVVVGAVTISFGVWVALSIAQAPGFFDQLYDAFLLRSGASGATQPWNSLVDYVWKLLWTKIRIRYTEALFPLAVSGLWMLFLSRRSWPERQLQVTGIVVGVLLLTATLHIAVFRQGAFEHDYWSYYYAPPLAILGALGIMYMACQVQRPAASGWRSLAGVALAMLLVALVLSDARWIRALYRERDDFPVLIAPAIQEHTPPGQVVVSNLDWWPAVWYYSQRDIIHKPNPDLEAAQGAVRMDCARDGTSLEGGDRVDAGQWTCVFSALR